MITAGPMQFADTRWTLVGMAVGGDRALAQRALRELCLQYWYPVYAYLRRCGHAPALAEDIATAYFQDLLHSRLPLAAAPAHTRFRDFLLDSLHDFLTTDWRQKDAAHEAAEMLRGPTVEQLEARHRYSSAAAANGEAAVLPCEASVSIVI